MAARTGRRRCPGPPASLTRTCQSCGRPLAADAVICPACGEPTLEAERKLVTVLFADLAGYTALAAGLDPEEVYVAVRPWITALRLIVEGYGGSVPQVMGDGFMAVFGVPTAHEDDAERAVRAGLELVRYGGDLEADQNPPYPGVHVGINTGEVLVGASREASGFLVVGDAVNVAARLADLARSGEILVGDPTRRLSRHAISYGPRSLRTARGKGELASYAARAVIGAAGGRPDTGLGLRRRPGQSTRPQLAPFVDRTAILGRLATELRQVAARKQSRVRVVVDEPGVGKSRLAEELASRHPEVLLLRAACQPYGQRLPLSALADAVGGHLGLGSKPSRQRVRHAVLSVSARGGGETAVARLEAQLMALVAPHAGRTRDGDRDAIRPGGAGIDVSSAVRPVLRAIAGGRPLLVVLDDLQWADPDLVAFLKELHAAPWSEPVLFLALARPEPEDRHRGLPVLPLGGLRAAEAREVLRGSIGGGIPASVAKRLIERAAGNPLFLEESARMLVERGAIVRSATRWRLSDPGALEMVPASLRLLVAARLDGLASAEKRVLQEASIAGVVTWDGLVAELVRRRSPTARAADYVVDAALQALEERDLLRRRPISSVAGSVELEFKHVVIRDVAYESLPRSARAAGHLAAAEWIRDHLGDSALAALAHHYERAWELARSKTRGPADSDTGRLAATYLSRWGDQVFAVQPRLAESLYARGLAIARESGTEIDASVLTGLLVGRAESLAELGRHREAIGQSEEALALATGDGPSDSRAYALLALARAHSNVGDVALARDLIREADRLFESTGSVIGQARAAHRLAEASRFDDFRTETESYRLAYHLYQGAGAVAEQAMVAQDLAYLLTVVGGSEFRRWFERASRLVAASGDERGRAALHRASAYASWYRLEPDRATSAAREARPLAAEAGDRWIEVDSLLVEAQAWASSGSPVEAERRLRELAEIAQSAGARHLRALVLLAGARPAQRLGRPVRGTRRLATARRMLVDLGVAMEIAEVDLAEAALLLERGAWDRVAPPASAAEARAKRNGWRLLEPLGPLLRGRAHLGAGRLADAAIELRRAVREARAVEATGTLSVAVAVLAQVGVLQQDPAGRNGRERADHEGHPAGVHRGGRTTVRFLDEDSPISLETEGLRALHAGDPAAAVAAFQRAVRTWSAVGLTAWQARAERFRSQALTAQGRPAAARAARRRAAAIVKAVGGQDSTEGFEAG